MKKGLIIGKGWLGSRLEKYLNNDYDLTTTKRNADAENCIAINFDEAVKPLVNYNSFDFIIITIPFGKRNTIEELINRFTNLITLIKEYQGQIILISSTGIYPNNSSIINEVTDQNTELIEPYITIENLVKDHFSQLNILRLGGLMGDDRFLSKYLTLDREGLDEVVNHVHYQDVCKSIREIITSNKRSNIYNLVAPQHPTKKEVLEYQINHNLITSNTKIGKIVSSEKIVQELKFEFDFPNPVLF